MTQAIKSRLAAAPVKFDPGRVLMTPGAVEALANGNDLVSTFLVRHCQGDWGELQPCDERENEKALKTGLRILSAYKTGRGEAFWIITEAVDVEDGADPTRRTITTVLLPGEY